jgi:hypothetical protein
VACCACARWDGWVRASDSHTQGVTVQWLRHTAGSKCVCDSKDPFRTNTGVLFLLHGTEMDAASAMREIKSNFLSSRGYISEY